VVSGYDEPECTNRARKLGASFARKCESIHACVLDFGRQISVGLHVADEKARRLLEELASGELRREILGKKDAPLAPFTIREAEVLALAWEGYSYEGIAARSGMRLGTVKTHATAVSRKCGGVGLAHVIWRLRIALREKSI
jgi:DNA-binding NarL/FixJ family response regulator